MRNITEINVENKKVILRVDYNVPIENGEVVDNNRIVESLKTINYLLEHNAKIIIMSHLGKVKTESDLKNTLLPVKEELEKLLKMPIKFCGELKGERLEKLVNDLKSKEILLLENTRHMDYPDNLESGCDESLSSYWASLADVFILDAFGSVHRPHASVYGISKYLPHAVGFLIMKEVSELDKIKTEDKIIILGGAKVSDKIGLILKLYESSSLFLIGGAMCATFLKAKGLNVGSTYVEEDMLDKIKKLLKNKKIILPVDVVTENGIKKVENISYEEHILDIGPETIKLFIDKLDKNKLILINGTMGKYEEAEYENGTKSIFMHLKEKDYKVIVCGGDTGSACKKYQYEPYYLSTGGGASLEYLEGSELKSLEIMNIKDKEKEENKEETEKKLIVLNHKSYLSYNEVEEYINKIKNINYGNLLILPNIAYIPLFKGTNLNIGSQNFYSYNFGSYTGETSLEILKGLGVNYTLVGHPERITLKLDSYEEIKDKLFKSVSSGFKTILCLMHDDKESTLKKELKYYLKGIDNQSIKNLLIAYEPSNRLDSDTVSMQNIKYVSNYIKKYMNKHYGIDVPFLYGGGVNKKNAREVLAVTDGIILGKNSTDIDELNTIIESLK